MNEKAIRMTRALWPLAAALAAHASQAATIRVPADVATIQGAIDVAVSGDRVLVAPGTYNEVIDFLGKAIEVSSEQGAAVTIIDGGRVDSVVRFHSGEPRSAMLRGFTLRNGNAVSYPDEGGGISVYQSSPTIEDNEITNSSACDGNGIALDFSSALVRRNHVYGNHQDGCYGGTVGGGIEIGGVGSAVVVDNLVENNQTDMGGGGIGLFAAGTPTVMRNVIRYNTSGNNGGGVATYNDSRPDFADNVIYGNTSAQGGGIALSVPEGSTGGVWVNNTVADNIGLSGGSELYTSGFVQSVTLMNNVFRTTTGTSSVDCDTLYTSQPPIFRTNDIFAKVGVAGAGSCANVAGVGGDLTVNPGFEKGHPQAPYHLSSTSPLIDVGTPTTLAGRKDADDKKRVVDGRGTGTAIIDIGAYEYHPGQ